MLRLKRGPKIIGALIAAGAAFGGIRYASTRGFFGIVSAPSEVPVRAPLPSVVESTAAATPVDFEMPTAVPGCTSLPEVRALVWAWNAQMGWMFANGGPVATERSLMCKNGVNLKLIRQDDAEQMKAELLTYATHLKSGEANPTSGAQFVAIMGDGAAQFFAALAPKLRRLGPEYKAVVVASAGYSRGEDKFMGLPAWKQSAESARGAYIAGYLKDGDWNIALKWAGDNGICNNPDERSYDPDCLNWAAAKDYIDAAQKYVEHYCEDLPVKGRPGEKRQVCVNGVVTWTPGDVIVAEKRGGLVSVVSTKEYVSQMPNVIIGIEPWLSRHRETVQGMTAAILEGGRIVKSSRAALERAAQVSDQVYQEKDTGPGYWLKYFEGTTWRDREGLAVQLGGSKVNDLGDNIALFGLAAGYANAFEATYTVFGNIVHQQYPKDVPSFPPARDVVDTSYLQRLLERSPHTAGAALEAVSYESVSEGRERTEVGRRSWKIAFDPGKDTFRPDAVPVLRELMRGLVVAGSTAVEIHGHTDNVGGDAMNKVLSEKRAFAVKQWLQSQAEQNFPDRRFRVFAHGSEQPVAPNATEEGRAANRRVEVVLLSK
jgi:outer membrane protein OmpA-like peptidoglycan-associated protein